MNQGKQVNGKRKLSSADDASDEEENVTALSSDSFFAVTRKRKLPYADEESEDEETVSSDSLVAGEDSEENEEKNASTSTKQSKSGSLASASTDDDRKDKRDRRTLFLKNLPGHCTVRQIKTLSMDIKHVRLRSTVSKIDNKTKRILYAYVSFASEEVAEKNFKRLDGKVFNGTIISVDYVGSKSQFLTTRPKKEPGKIDPLRLYLSSLPGNATEADIQKLFPEAVEILMPRRCKDKLLFGYGFVGFNDPALTSKYHDQGQDLILHGKKLDVLYAKQRKSENKKWKEAQKGTKPVANQDVDMDQDDDEDDDDEEEIQLV